MGKKIFNKFGLINIFNAILICCFIFTGCNNSLQDGSIVIKLPTSSSRETASQSNSQTTGTSESFVYEISLDGPTKKTIPAKSGELITIGSLMAGDYIVECNSFYKSDNAYYAQGTTQVRVNPGEIAPATIKLEKKFLAPEIVDIKIGEQITDPKTGEATRTVSAKILTKQRGMYMASISNTSITTDQKNFTISNLNKLENRISTIESDITLQTEPLSYTIISKYTPIPSSSGYNSNDLVTTKTITIPAIDTSKFTPPVNYSFHDDPITESDILTFGDWPQSKKESDVTIFEQYPQKVNGWTFYVGSDKQYYVKEGNDYYKVEPIIWNCISASEKFYVAQNILTSGIPFYDNTQTRTISGSTIYPNNYEHSAVRAYLNGLSYNKDSSTDSTYMGNGFLQLAFTETGRTKIADTTVDNSQSSAGDNGSAINCSYSCNNTLDKIFLLSENELTSNPFKGYSENDALRKKIPTDYCQAKSIPNANEGRWWERSPYDNDSQKENVIYVDNDGSVAPNLSYDYSSVNTATIGIVPALKLNQ